MLSITCPQGNFIEVSLPRNDTSIKLDANSFKAVIETDIKEFISPELVEVYVNDRWLKYGQVFLDLCTGCSNRSK